MAERFKSDEMGFESVGAAFGMNWPSLERTKDITEGKPVSREDSERVLERERLRGNFEETPKSVKYEEGRSSLAVVVVVVVGREGTMMMMMVTDCQRQRKEGSPVRKISN